MTAGARTTRADVEELLRRWLEGHVNASGVKQWVEQAAPPADRTVEELLSDLDVLEVHLLTPDDVPAMLAFLQAADFDAAMHAWTHYRDGIDIDARSRALRKNRFYRPFCR